MPLAFLLIMLSTSADTATGESSFSSTHLLISAYFTGGSYSTATRSRSLGFYATVTDTWRDHYTVGFERLWLERDDAGGRYYTQNLVTARASWWLGSGFAAALHYAYLHEGEIASYSPPARFQVFGGGGNYWVFPSLTVGSSVTLAYGDGVLQASAIRGGVSLHLGKGIWSVTSVVSSEAEWSPRLLMFRQGITIPLGSGSSLLASVDIGRRVFYFDEDLLLFNNQRPVQTGDYQLKGTIKVFDRYYLIPTVKYAVSDSYHVTYGSIGLRIVW